MKSIGWRLWVLFFAWVTVSSVCLAGVSKEIENEYKVSYENKALFLKIPVRGARQVLYLRGTLTVPDQSNLGENVSFKVGEQIRITKVDFKDAVIDFQFSSLDMVRKGLITFQFAGALDFSFPQRPAFDAVLAETFTEGLSYADLDKAKETYIRDQFSRTVRQFADMTETSNDFVIQAILQETQEYASLKKQFDELSRKAAALEQQLAEESRKRQDLETQARGNRTDLDAANRTNTQLRGERDQLAQERTRLSREVADLKSANDKFEAQLKAVADKLNLQLNSNSQLGQQVDKLSDTIDALRKERDTLSTRSKDLEVKLGTLTRERDGLDKDLKASQRQVSRLEADLNSLTSNRNSLESTYLRVKREKEGFETAEMIEKAFHLVRGVEERKDGTYQVARLLLKNQQVGVLETQLPSGPGQPFAVTFKAASRDTVQFTDDERQLFEALGNALKIEIRLSSWSGALTPILKQGEALQTIPAREEGTWQWELQGVADRSEEVSLQGWVTDAAGHAILFATQEIQVAPSSWVAGLLGGFSLVSAGIGFLIGIALLGLAFALRGRSQPSRPAAERKAASFPTEKRL